MILFSAAKGDVVVPVALGFVLIFMFAAAAAVAQDVEAVPPLPAEARPPVGREPPAPVDQGGAAAPYALGLRYVNGDGVAPDYIEAERWFEQAARRGHVEARRHLIFMRRMGLAAAATPARPFDWAFRIQVATVPNESDAPREWRRLQRRHVETLGSLDMLAVAFDTPEGGRLYRVQGGPLDEEGARAACARLREEGTGCLTVRPQ